MARVHCQAAVIPYRIRKARVEVALITTSTGKGWILPKGSVDQGERPREAAIREAEEEAGLRGVVARKPVGRYHHAKGDDLRRVDVYIMRVTRELDHWLEEKTRRRRWMRVADAADRLRDELQPLVHGLEAAVETHADARKRASTGRGRSRFLLEKSRRSRLSNDGSDHRRRAPSRTFVPPHTGGVFVAWTPASAQ